MKRINRILNIVLGNFLGVFIGHAIYVCWDYKAHPQMYAMQSAPWYTSIVVYGAVTLVILLAALLAKFFLKKYAAKKGIQI